MNKHVCSFGVVMDAVSNYVEYLLLIHSQLACIGCCICVTFALQMKLFGLLNFPFDWIRKNKQKFEVS